MRGPTARGRVSHWLTAQFYTFSPGSHVYKIELRAQAIPHLARGHAAAKMLGVFVFPGPVLFAMTGGSDQQPHQQHLGMCWRRKFLGPTGPSEAETPALGTRTPWGIPAPAPGWAPFSSTQPRALLYIIQSPDCKLLEGRVSGLPISKWGTWKFRNNSLHHWALPVCQTR